MTSGNQGARVAFIGLGRMGLPMAGNLLKAGFTVTGSDLSEAARAAFVAAGGAVAATAREAAAGHDIIVTMLPTSAIVADSLIGAGNALADVAAGALVIDMSSSVPADTVALDAALSARGLHLVDAPVSGGVVRAVSAQLAIMAGGADAAVDRAEPVLRAMGDRIFRTGKIGSGHVMKVLNNYVSAAGALATVEALIMGRDFGLDQSVMTDVLNASSGRNNTTEIKVKRFILSETWDSGFEMALMSKDVRIAADLADRMGLRMDLLQRTAADWTAATETLEKGADHTEIYRYADRHARDK